MVEICYIDLEGNKCRLELNGWPMARGIAKALAKSGCKGVTARSIRKDLYVVDPETWHRELIAANVLLSEVPGLTGWWCKEYENYGLAVMPAQKRTRLKVLQESKRVG